MRFAQHFLDTAGKWRAVEQGGPANVEVWRLCWGTFTVAAIATGIAAPAALSRYALRFEERCNRYTRSLHLCVKAEERCRTEFWPAERRRQERFRQEHPGLSAVDEAMPWNTVIKESTDNLDFWLHELQEPAMLYAQTRGDENPSWAHQQREHGAKTEKGRTGKGGHPRMLRGRYQTNQGGNAICFKFNHRTCEDNCPRSHQCEFCLGPHRGSNCSKKDKGKKGKGKAGKHGDARQEDH